MEDRITPDPLSNIREMRLAVVKRHTRNLSTPRVNSFCACVKFGERYCSPQPIFKNTTIYRIRRSFLTRKDPEGISRTWYKSEAWRIECWQKVNEDRLKIFNLQTGNLVPEPIPIDKPRVKKGSKLQDLSKEQKKARGNLQTKLGIYQKRLVDYETRLLGNPKLNVPISNTKAKILLLKGEIKGTLVLEPERELSDEVKELMEQLL
jgi:hypothetical protein